jgi:hypothetical protein
LIRSVWNGQKFRIRAKKKWFWFAGIQKLPFSAFFLLTPPPPPHYSCFWSQFGSKALPPLYFCLFFLVTAVTKTLKSQWWWLVPVTACHAFAENGCSRRGDKEFVTGSQRKHWGFREFVTGADGFSGLFFNGANCSQ